MESFLNTAFPDTFVRKTALPGDGGHRRYFRLKVKNSSFILMSAGKESGDLKDFIRIQKILRAEGLPVPLIFQKDLKKGLLILEDLGDVTLESLQRKNKTTALVYYHQTLKDLVKLQTCVPVSNSFPRFGKNFFLEETDLALWRLKTLVGTLERNKEDKRGKEKKEGESPLQDQKSGLLGFKEEMGKVCDQLDSLPFVFCHRDFHSRNLMMKEGRARWIDFQDGGRGPYCYDLCSLVYDSYVSFTEKERRGLTDFYFQSLPEEKKKAVGGEDKVWFFTCLQFLQRGFKACGCFAGFYNDNGKTAHLPYIHPTLQILEKTALELSFNKTAEYLRHLREQLKFLDQIYRNSN